MARDDSKRENQHYLPKLLLRNFVEPGESPGKEKIWVFDKSKSSTFRTNIRNVAAEGGFYEIGNDSDSTTAESLLSRLEANAAQSLRKIVERRNLRVLSPSDRQWLMIFCAVQLIRVPNTRERQKAMGEAIEKRITESGGDVNNVTGYKPMTANELKEFATSLIARAAKDFSPHFGNKVSLLLETHIGDPFFLGDNPVAMHNANDLRPYGNIGLAVPGIEIYFPISPTLTLTFWEQSVPERLLRSIAIFRARFEGIRPASTIRDHLRGADELIAAAQTGGVSRCGSEVVMFLNSLQVINSSRFVLSATKDFSLASRMVAEKPHLRMPPLFEMA